MYSVNTNHQCKLTLVKSTVVDKIYLIYNRGKKSK